MVLAQRKGNVDRRDNSSEKLLDSNMLSNRYLRRCFDGLLFSSLVVACIKLARALTHDRTFRRRLRTLYFFMQACDYAQHSRENDITIDRCCFLSCQNDEHVGYIYFESQPQALLMVSPTVSLPRSLLLSRVFFSAS